MTYIQETTLNEVVYLVYANALMDSLLSAKLNNISKSKKFYEMLGWNVKKKSSKEITGYFYLIKNLPLQIVFFPLIIISEQLVSSMT